MHYSWYWLKIKRQGEQVSLMTWCGEMCPFKSTAAEGKEMK